MPTWALHRIWPNISQYNFLTWLVVILPSNLHLCGIIFLKNISLTCITCSISCIAYNNLSNPSNDAKKLSKKFKIGPYHLSQWWLCIYQSIQAKKDNLIFLKKISFLVNFEDDRKFNTVLCRPLILFYEDPKFNTVLCRLLILCCADHGLKLNANMGFA